MIELPYLAKPMKGSPCNGCGWCCSLEICLIGKGLLGDIPAPCPLLVYRDGRTFCGVMDLPLPEETAKYLGIGMGCCSNDPA